LNVSTGSLVQTLDVGDAPTFISSDGTHVWVVNSNDNTVSEISIAAQPPKINSFSPSSGPVGTVVTIKGGYLSGATAVTFRGSDATIISDTAAKIKIKVPPGARTAKIEVFTPDGNVQTATEFRVT
jgi:DNA-binding beta-propeller fold protein YncE